MSKIFFISFLLLLVPACSAFTTTPPTPSIIVVTATPDAQPSAPAPTFSVPQATALPNATIAPGATVTATAPLNLKPTNVKYVRAKQDINIRNGPGTNFEIVGGVYAGQTAQVTGYTSADEKWWRVVCPTDRVTECWVSADPELTEPTTAPNPSPGQTPRPEANVETFVRQFAAAQL